MKRTSVSKPNRTRTIARLEELEQRQLMTADMMGGPVNSCSMASADVSYSGGVVTVVGTDCPDTIEVVDTTVNYKNRMVPGILVTAQSGTNTVAVRKSYRASLIDRVMVYGKGGNDAVTVRNDNVAQIYGGAGDDRLRGGDANDRIDGQEGNDRIYGGDGGDLLYGGTGDDSIYGNGGNDRITADDGDDWVSGDDGRDTIFGSAGNDILFGGADDDQIDGGHHNDRLYGDAGEDQLDGQAGNDSLWGGGANDTLSGGSGADRLDGQNGNDVLLGGSDRDTLYGGSGNDELQGGQHNDSLYGQAGLDNLYGNAGADTLSGGDGADGLYGGLGIDQLSGNGGNDRFLTHASDADSISDKTSADAEIVFRDDTDGRTTADYEYDSGSWTPEEIQRVDLGLRVLHETSSELLKTPAGNRLKFYRLGKLLSGAGFSGLNAYRGANRVIYLTDSAFDSDDWLTHATIHEVAHHWQDATGDWSGFLAISGWVRSDKDLTEEGMFESGEIDDNWWHSGEQFVSSYAMNVPQDDFAETFTYHLMDGSAWSFSNSIVSNVADVADKLEFIEAFFARF